MNKEIFSVIAFIRHGVRVERHVSDRRVEEVVGKVGFLKALDLYVRILIKLLCNASRYAVEFHTAQMTVLSDFFVHCAEKVANAHSRLQNIAALKSEVL